MKKLTGTILAAATALVALPAGAADVAPRYMPPPAAGYVAPAYAPPACYAVFFMYEDGKGPSLVRQGPEEVPVIRRLRYPGGPSLNGRVLSVTTSPGAVVQLFNGRKFRVPMMKVGPESTVNLARPVADSYTIDCVAPLPPAPPPASFK